MLLEGEKEITLVHEDSVVHFPRDPEGFSVLQDWLLDHGIKDIPPERLKSRERDFSYWTADDIGQGVSRLVYRKTGRCPGDLCRFGGIASGNAAVNPQAIHQEDIRYSHGIASGQGWCNASPKGGCAGKADGPGTAEGPSYRSYFGYKQDRYDRVTIYNYSHYMLR